MASRIVSALFVGAMLLCAAPAFAQQAELDAQVQHGIALRESNQADAALEHFRRVWESTRYPRALAQIAVTEQTLGRWVEADRSFRAVLALSAHPWVQQNRARVEQSLATVGEHLGEFEVSGVPPGTELWVDDQRVATTPLAAALRLTIGTHTLELRAEGFVTARRALLINARSMTRETVVMVREAASPAAHEGPTPPATVLVTDSDPGRTQRIFGWVSLGLAAVGVGLGVTGAIYRADASHAFGSVCQPEGMPYLPLPCAAQAGELERFGTLMGAGFGAAGAFGLTSLVLLVSAPSRPHVSRASMGCAPGLGSVQCSWAF